MSFLLVLLIPAFAFLYRCRGGFLGTGHTQLGRMIYWAIPVGMWASFQAAIIAPAVVVTAFLGLLIPHAAFQADASLKSCAGMAGVGLARLSLILAPLAYFQPMIMCLAPIGLLQGAAYAIGWDCLNGVDSRISTNGFSFAGIQFAAGKFAVMGAEWGEVLTGAVFGLAFALIGG